MFWKTKTLFFHERLCLFLVILKLFLKLITYWNRRISCGSSMLKLESKIDCQDVRPLAPTGVIFVYIIQKKIKMPRSVPRVNKRPFSYQLLWPLLLYYPYEQ